MIAVFSLLIDPYFCFPQWTLFNDITLEPPSRKRKIKGEKKQELRLSRLVKVTCPVKASFFTPQPQISWGAGANNASLPAGANTIIIPQ